MLDRGTSEASPSAAGHVTTRAYRNGRVEAQDFPLADVSDYLARPDVVVWVDLLVPSLQQLASLAEELGLHELAVEDAVSRHQRPKLDRYDTHLFIACHAVGLDHAGALLTTEVDLFVNARWLVTVRKRDDLTAAQLTRRFDRSPHLAAQGVSYLLYCTLDEVVDTYFEALQNLDTYYDEVSGQLFDGTPLAPDQQRRWFEARQSLVQLHRLAVPLREAVSGLMRREDATVAQTLYPYYQDVYDHILRVSESADALRELVSTIVETNLSLRDYRQNQIVKKVSSWAAIVAVPALITGYYGMNVPFPGAGEPIGAATASTLIVAMSAALYAIFRRNDWL